MKEDIQIAIFRHELTGLFSCLETTHEEYEFFCNHKLFVKVAIIEPTTWIEALLNHSDVSNNNWVKITLSKTP